MKNLVLEWQRPRVVAATVGALCVALILAGIGPLDSGHALRSIAAWVALFFFPGALLVFLCLDRVLNLGEIIPFSFGLGLVAFAPYAFAAYCLKLPLSCGVGYLVTLSVGLTVLLAVRRRRTVILLAEPRVLVLVAVGTVFAVLMFRMGSIQVGDTVTHLAWIRQLLARGVADADVYRVVSDGPFWVPYMFNSWHLTLATVASFTHSGLHDVWLNFASIAVLPSILAVWALSRTIFRSSRIAFLAGLSHLFQVGVLTAMYIWWVSPYPDQVGKLLLIVLLSLALEFRDRGKKLLLVPLAIGGLALLLTHISSFLLFCLSASAIGVALWFVGRRTEAKRLLAVLVVGVLSAAPGLLLKGLFLLGGSASQSSLGFATTGYEPEEFLMLPGGWLVVRPPLNWRNLFFPFSVVGLILFPALLVSWVRTRGEGVWITLAGLAGVILFVFNPLLATAVAQLLNGNLVSRAMWGLALFGLHAFSFYASRILSWIERACVWLKHDATATGAVLAASALVLFVAPRFSMFPDEYALRTVIATRTREGHLAQASTGFGLIGEFTEERTTILASGTYISDAGPFFDRNLIPSRLRVLAVYSELLGQTMQPTPRRLQLLGELEVDYILTQGQLEAEILGSYPGLFTLLGADPPFSVFAVDLSATEEAVSRLRASSAEIALQGKHREAALLLQRWLQLRPSDPEPIGALSDIAALELDVARQAIQERRLKDAGRSIATILSLNAGGSEVSDLSRDLSALFLQRSAEKLALGDSIGALDDLRSSLAHAHSPEAERELEDLTSRLVAAGRLEIIRISPIGSPATGDIATFDAAPAPEFWNPQGDELTDGSWSSTNDSIAWRLRGVPITVGFDLGKPQALTGMVIRSHHFTDGYASADWEIEIQLSEDGVLFRPVSALFFLGGELGEGDHAWTVRLNNSARHVRVILRGAAGTVTLGEVEFWANSLVAQ